MKKTLTNNKGFTLIELMIVIAIIGILAAIAIPNFIAYRNKAFCSRAESDANGIAGAIADYFAIPTHTVIPTIPQLNGGNGYTLSGNNTAAPPVSADPNVSITIVVTDGSARCPTDYVAAMTAVANPKGFWTEVAAPGGDTYTLVISQ